MSSRGCNHATRNPPKDEETGTDRPAAPYARSPWAGAPAQGGLTAPVLRYHGGKFRLAPWVLSHFPPHERYVEPYGGAASVLLLKPPCGSEVLNDLDGDVVNFYRVLRDDTLRARLVDQCALTPAAREEFDLAFEPCEEPVERARRLAVRAMLGYGSAGASKATTGMRIFGGDGKHRKSDMERWARYPDVIASVGARLRSVLIECRPALEVMFQHDGPRTLHYVDPPYLHSTRVRASGSALRYYRHEMGEWDHVHLLSAIQNLQGAVVLSGYQSELYDNALKGWRRVECQSRASAHRGTVLRTEVLWVRGPLTQSRS
jgi:DNA adenine methylase